MDGLKTIHVVFAKWCPHCVPTTVEPLKAAAKEAGLELRLYDIDDPRAGSEADELVRKWGDWAKDYIIPQVFFEYADSRIEHVMTGFSEGVPFTDRAVRRLIDTRLKGGAAN